jgi:hypothetical protein
MAVTNSTRTTGTGNTVKTSATGGSSGGTSSRAASPGNASGAARTRKATQSSVSGPTAGAPQPNRKSLEQHLQTMSEMDASTPAALYEWMESVRAIAAAQAFFAHAAASQLYGAARQAAKQGPSDGRMTLAEKAKLRIELMRLSRAVNRGTAESFLAAASSTVKAWTRFQTFLDELQSDQVQRPHRSAKGGFDPYGGI